MTIYFSENENEWREALKNIKPGSVVLFSAAGRNRPFRIQDRLIMLGQALFRKEYQPEYKRANAGITHVGIAVANPHDLAGMPYIVEINSLGASSHRLEYSFYYKFTRKHGRIEKFRPLHIFCPTHDAFRENLATVAKSFPAHAQNERPQVGAKWKLGKAIGALFNFKKTKGTGLAKEEKDFELDTQCAALAVRCMKKAAHRSQQGLNEEVVDPIREYYPDIPSNVSPSALLSYFLDKVEGENPLYEHDIHLDIDPYKGLQAVIDQQIARLEKKTLGKESASEKAEALRTAKTDSLASINQTLSEADSLTKARKLLADMNQTLNQPRGFNPFKQTTALAKATQYVKDAETYTTRLR